MWRHTFFIINQTPQELSYLSFKHKKHEVFLNHLCDFKSQSMSREKNLYFLSNFFIFFTLLDARLKSLNN